jgi:DNA-binding MarR family transcriptional regulator
MNARSAPLRASKASARSKTPAHKDVRLDDDIEKLLVATTDAHRMIRHELRRLSRHHKLSERSLNIITMVNAGLNRPSMLINYFEVLPSTITSETDRLVAAGLLERHAHPTDRRISMLALTVRGHKVREEALAVLNQTFRSRLDKVSAKNLQVCIDTLHAIMENSIVPTPFGNENG